MSESVIERTPGFKVGTQFFPTLAEAQTEALKALLMKNPKGVDVDTAAATSEILVERTAEAVAILAPPKELRSKATRRDKGVKRARKATATSGEAA